MRPIFTIHAGEYLVGSYIEENFKSLSIWIPSKDSGIDLLVTNKQNNKAISLQVKFSKDFLGKDVKQSITRGIKSGGWWTFQKDKLEKSQADFWILVLYQFQNRKYDFVIIPPKILLDIYNRLNPKNKLIQSYIWITSNKNIRCWEARGLKKMKLN